MSVSRAQPGRESWVGTGPAESALWGSVLLPRMPG